ncbi:MAG: AsmA family protein [Lautropia sp.]
MRKSFPAGWHPFVYGAALCLAVAGVASAVGELTGWPWLRVPAASVLSRVLDREVRIDAPFRLHLLASPSLRLGSVSIAGPAWREDRTFVRLDGLRIGARWRDLLASPVSIASVSIDEGEIDAVRTEDGRATWQLGPARASAEPADAPHLPDIGTVRIGALAVRVDDAVAQLRIDVDARTVDASEGAGSPNTLVAAARGEWAGRPVRVDVSVPAWLDAATSMRVNALSLDASVGDARLRYRGDVDGLPSLARLSGEVALEGRSLAALGVVPGLTLPETRPFDLKGRIERDGGRIAFRTEHARIGDSVLGARLEYDTAPRVPRLSGELTADKLLLADLAPSVGGGGGEGAGGGDRRRGGTEDRQSSKRLSDEAFDLPALRRMDADIAIDLKLLDLGTPVLGPLRGVRGRIGLDDGAFAIADLQASVAGGSIAGRTTLDASDSRDEPTWEATLDWKRVDLKRWIRAADDAFFVAGRFSGHTAIRSRGRSPAAILGAADGSVRGSIANGAISHLLVEAVDLDLGQALGVAMKEEEPLALSCAMLDIAIERGRVTPKLVLLNTKDSVVFVDGSANLRTESLDLRLVPAPKDWSPLSLAAPVTIGGTFAKPSLGVEPRPIALKVLSAIVLGAINPIAAVLPFIEAPKAQDEAGCEPAIALVRNRGKALRAGASGDGPQARAGDRPAADDPPERILPPPDHPALNSP